MSQHASNSRTLKRSTKIGLVLCVLGLCAAGCVIYFLPTKGSPSDTDVSPATLHGPKLKISIDEYGGGGHAIETELLGDGVASDPFVLNSVSFVFPETLSDGIEINELGSIQLESEFDRLLSIEPNQESQAGNQASGELVASYRAECTLRVITNGSEEASRYAVVILQGDDEKTRVMAWDFDNLTQAPEKMRQALTFAIELMRQEYESFGVSPGN